MNRAGDVHECTVLPLCVLSGKKNSLPRGRSSSPTSKAGMDFGRRNCASITYFAVESRYDRKLRVSFKERDIEALNPPLHRETFARNAEITLA